MEARTARRSAEKAARDLIRSRAAFVGELAALHSDRLRLTHDVTTAAARGEQLVEEAKAEAASRLAVASELAQDGERRYADAHAAAVAAGWTTADLAALGFPAARRKGRRRGQPTAASTKGSAPSDEAAPLTAASHRR